MRHLTCGDLMLVLDDMFTNKLVLIQPTLAFQLFGPSLGEKRRSLSSVQKGLARRPLKEALRETDREHQSTGRALYYVCRGMEQLELLPLETRAVFTRVREVFVPSLSVLTKSYEDEAAFAKRLDDDALSLKPSLETIPLGNDLTLYSLVFVYVEAGKKIDSLLSSRADTRADDEVKRTREVNRLRSLTLGVLSQFREALVQEISVNSDLPRDLESKVFSYLDQLCETRDQRSAGKRADDTADDDNSHVSDVGPETPYTAGTEAIPEQEVVGENSLVTDDEIPPTH